MPVYLIDNPPRIRQYRTPRRARPTGLTVLHTAESVMDSVGPDTGAENVAAFIRGRTTYGSYHDLCDKDSALQLVRYSDEAYHDGTGSNAWSLSISWALAAADWPKLNADDRHAYLRSGAVAFARQQTWLRENGYPTTPLRRLDRDQSERGLAGFIKHGDRDPGRRSDPGLSFPWEDWFDACADALAADSPPLTYVEVDVEFPEVRKGQTGEHVETVQHLLLARRADLLADGDFGPTTELQLRHFQQRAGIATTGVVDAATWRKLLRTR